jgi:hypothetical protein
LGGTGFLTLVADRSGGGDCAIEGDSGVCGSGDGSAPKSDANDFQ